MDARARRAPSPCGRGARDALSFICIPPGSAVIYRLIVYVILYMLAGKVHSELES